MKVNLQHHYGWRTYDTCADTLDGAAYAAVRACCDFLTDDNHTHTIHRDGEYTSVWIVRNERSPKPLPALTPTWYTSDPGDLWFAMAFRPAKSE